MDSLHSGQWERLNAVIMWAGMSVHAFAYNLGLKRSENLYRIKSHKNGISRKLVERIIEAYPEISDIWLMTGSGTMLKSIDYVNVIDVPYYGAGIVQFLETPERCNSRYVIPVTYNSEIAIDVDESIINDIIPTGTVALLKQIPKEKIVYDRPYYVVTEFFNEFCILRKSPNKNEILICGTIKEAEEVKNAFMDDEHEELKQLKIRVKELKDAIADKESKKNTNGEEIAENKLNESNSTAIEKANINYVFEIGGFVTKL